MLTETLAMGKALAARAGQAVDNSQEFVAMGVAVSSPLTPTLT
jgi:MFS superfamily sulfate permease-like transporter